MIVPHPPAAPAPHAGPGGGAPAPEDGAALARPPGAPPQASPPGQPPAPRPPWTPIRSLAPRHRPRILEHLLALPPHDRYLRFGHAASDAQIGRYVDLLDFERDELLGVTDRRLQVVAMAHLAALPSREGPPAAEFGVSVWPRHRGRGFGARLFERAVLLARNRGEEELLIHALVENRAMLRIAQRAGAVIVAHGSEAQARLRLPPQDILSHVEALLAQQTAELDHQLKLQSLQWRAWWQAWAQVLRPDVQDDRPPKP